MDYEVYVADIRARVNDAFDEVVKLLKERSIPFGKVETIFEKETRNYYKRISFPWVKSIPSCGSVSIGMLHLIDHIVGARRNFGYPTIETYGFMWDWPATTIYRTPQELVDKLSEYYRMVSARDIQKED